MRGLAERIGNTRLADTSTRDLLRLIESVMTIGDLDRHEMLCYLHAKQNERIIELLEAIEVDTARMALVQEDQP